MTQYERMLEEERALSRELQAKLTAQQAQLKAADEALSNANTVLQGFEMHVGGRIPSDSSDSMPIEAVHASRLCYVLQVIQKTLATIRAKEPQPEKQP